MHSAKAWLLIILCLVGIGVAWREWRHQTEIATLRDAALPREERAALQKRVWDLEKANRELRAQLPAASAASPAAAAPPSAGARPALRDSDRQFEAWRGLLAQPDVQAMVALQQKSAVESRYAALFKNLSLPPAQIEKLKALLADRALTFQDVLSVASDQGIDPRENPAALRQLLTKAQADINASLKSLLGEQGFTQLSVYEQTLPQREVVNDLQQRLSYTETPLTPTQAELLIQVLAANSAPRSAATAAPSSTTTGSPAANRTAELGGAIRSVLTSGGMLGPVMFADAPRTATITPAAVAQTQGFLSAPQIAALQQLQQQQQAQQQLRQKVTETLQPAAGAAGSGKK